MIFKDSDIGLLKFTVNFFQDNTTAILLLLSGYNTITPSFLLPFSAAPNGSCNGGICRDKSAIMQENT